MTNAAGTASHRQSRTIDISIDIKASPDDVWRALTEASELVRWFPLQASVTAGPGGSIHWSWDDAWSTDTRIEAWTPSRRLVLAEERPAFDANGTPVPGSRPARMVMEFTIEARAGGITRLRLIHSGFGTDAGWDDELDGTSAGWNVELRGLRHYLERHQGHDRIYAKAQVTTAVSTSEVWQRLLGPSGFILTDGRLEQGERCTVRSPWGEQISGSVLWIDPGWDILIAVDRFTRPCSGCPPGRRPGRLGFRSG